MSYDLYRKWLKTIPDSDLNREIGRLQARRRATTKTPKAYEAWSRMLEVAEGVQKARDEDHGHLLRGLNYH